MTERVYSAGYRYSGYLGTIMPPPDAAIPGNLDSIEFGANDLIKWTTRDLISENEWQRVPVKAARTPDGVSLEGSFLDIRPLDILAADDPVYWVPLGTIGWIDSRLPVDLSRYPVAEVTFRCLTGNAQPAWAWTYPGGLHLDMLPASRRWRTSARLIPHFGFPKTLDTMILRMYSTTRSVESIEIRSVRFRELSSAEREAIERDVAHLDQESTPKHYSALDEFLPLGVVMDAGVARRLAELLGVSLAEYWELAFEDIVAHHHNCILLDNTEHLTSIEWTELLSFASTFDVRIVPTLDFPITDDYESQRTVIESRIRPYANAPAILAWSLRKHPREKDFHDLIRARELVEAVDDNHPPVVITRYPSAYPLYARYSAVSGFSHFASHAPWDTGAAIQTHVPLAHGQQVWIMAPAFVYATGVPEWSTCPEIRLMANLAFAGGARGWFSYAYHNDPIWVSGSCQRTLTGPFLNFSDLWLELDRCMERFDALAPLLLETKPARLPRQWYVHGDTSGDMSQLPQGVSATSSFRLQGPDYSLFFVVSNDTRGMSKLNISIPRKSLGDLEIYVLSDFVQDRVWQPMNLERHIEMFPGQAHIVIVAKPSVCARWRDVIAQRLIEDDRRQLGFMLNLARTYQLDVSAVETLVERTSGSPLDQLGTMDRARDQLTDLIYASPAICNSRSEIIKAASAVCACDGALCRLVDKGKSDMAREMGAGVVPIARELMMLRLQIRQGRGGKALDHCRGLVDRALQLLSQIRAVC